MKNEDLTHILLFLVAGCAEFFEHIDYISDPAKYDDDNQE